MREQLPEVKCPDCGKTNTYRVTDDEIDATRATRSCRGRLNGDVCNNRFKFILDDVDGPGWKVLSIVTN